jgi:hypothetical protein
MIAVALMQIIVLLKQIAVLQNLKPRAIAVLNN